MIIFCQLNKRRRNENHRENPEWTIQINRQHRVNKTQNENKAKNTTKEPKKMSDMDPAKYRW